MRQTETDLINNCTEVKSKWLKHVARGIWYNRTEASVAANAFGGELPPPLDGLKAVEVLLALNPQEIYYLAKLSKGVFFGGGRRGVLGWIQPGTHVYMVHTQAAGPPPSGPDQSRLPNRVLHVHESGPVSKVRLLQLCLFKMIIIIKQERFMQHTDSKAFSGYIIEVLRKNIIYC